MQISRSKKLIKFYEIKLTTPKIDVLNKESEGIWDFVSSPFRKTTFSLYNNVVPSFPYLSVSFQDAESDYCMLNHLKYKTWFSSQKFVFIF